jgi:tetratricopeptide (TPR) repeat protein
MVASFLRCASLLLFLALTGSALVSAEAPPPEQAKRFAGQAVKLEHDEQYADAAEKMAEAVQLAPTNENYVAYTARLFAKAENYEQSLHHARAVVQLNPKDARHHLLVMRAANKLDRNDEAEAAARKVLALGRSGASKQSLDEARAFLENFDDYRAERMMGDAVALHRQGHLADALATLKDASALDARNTTLARYQHELEAHTRDDAIDEHALQAPKEAEKTFKALAAYLVKPCKDDREKARAVYRWVTDRLTYNVEEYFSNKQWDNSADTVFRTRKGVCLGFANVFQKLGEQAGLEVVRIGGPVKGNGYRPGDDLKKHLHAWNAVKIEKRWRLVDPTWGAGSINDKRQYEKRFREFYFLTPPELLIFDHFPEDRQWQQLPTPITLEEFVKWPKFKSHLFELGIPVKDIQARLKANPRMEFVEAWNFPGPRIQLQTSALGKRLRAGSKVHWRIQALGLQEVAIFNGGKWQTVPRTDDVFEIELKPEVGELKVSVVYPNEEERLFLLLRYVVE